MNIVYSVLYIYIYTLCSLWCVFVPQSSLPTLLKERLVSLDLTSLRFNFMSLWVDKYRPLDFSSLSFHPETTATLKDLVRTTE